MTASESFWGGSATSATLGKGALADALLPYLTDTGQLPPYRTVAEQLGLTEGATKVAVHRLRQRFGDHPTNG